MKQVWINIFNQPKDIIFIELFSHKIISPVIIIDITENIIDFFR